MQLSERVEKSILEADSKALATTGPEGINIVPVSTVRIVDHQIWLMNYLFGKTLSNFQANPQVALAVWSGFEGYQIKGQLEYLTEGETFLKAKDWVSKNTVDRNLVGLAIIDPQEVYNLSTSKV
jgi:hypothetical protein